MFRINPKADWPRHLVFSQCRSPLTNSVNRRCEACNTTPSSFGRPGDLPFLRASTVQPCGKHNRGATLVHWTRLLHVFHITPYCETKQNAPVLLLSRRKSLLTSGSRPFRAT